MQSDLEKAQAEIIRVQIERFHHFYADYFKREETHVMVEYFFDRIYGLESDREWKRLALTTFQTVKHLVKEETRANIEHLMELNELTEELDADLARLLIDRHGAEHRLSVNEYRDLYCSSSSPEKRRRHLELVLANMESFYQLAHRPINAYIMKPARFMTKMLGIYPLFKTVEEGYYAVLPVTKELFESFVEEVSRREWEYLNSAFANAQT